MFLMILLFTFLELCAIAFRIFVGCYNPANNFYKMVATPATWVCVAIGVILVILIGVEIFIRIRKTMPKGNGSVTVRGGSAKKSPPAVKFNFSKGAKNDFKKFTRKK